MSNNVTARSNLWEERIQSFQKSGKSQKSWCNDHGIPQSTFSYWVRKLKSASDMKGSSDDPVFARLPMEQELSSGCSVVHAPAVICLPENIRIEVSADCPAGLIAALLHALKNYA